MNWQAAVYEFGARGLIATLPLLMVSSLAIVAIRQPVRRAWLIEFTLVICLAAPWLAFLPALPRWSVARSARSPRDAQTNSPVDATKRQGSEAADRALNDSTNRPAVSIAADPAVNLSQAPEVNLTQIQDARTAPPSRQATTSSPGPTVAVIDFRRWTAVGYLTGFGLMTAWWAFGMVGLLRVLRSAQPAGERCRQIFDAVAGNAGSSVRLMVSSQIQQPFTFTWRRAVIVVPAKLAEGAERQSLRWALAHEWAHVRRRDALTWMLAGMARIVFFYQPLVWWLRGQLRLMQDYIADAEAAGHAPSVEDYAEFLTTWVAAHSGRPPAVGLGIGSRTSELYRRVVMLLERRRPLEIRCPRLWRWSAAVCTLSLVAAAVTYGVPPKRPPVKKPSVDVGKTAPDNSASPGNSEARRIVDAVLKRATAIKSGRIEFRESFEPPNPAARESAYLPYGYVAPPQPIWRCSLSGDSWAIRIQSKTTVVNHDGRVMELGRASQLTIEPATTWTEKQFQFPFWVGTIAREPARRFLRDNADRGHAAGVAKVDGVETRVWEWEIPPADLRAFDFVNDMLKGGGVLRLYVAEQLGAVLPKIEYVDRFGTVQASFSATDFQEVATGVFFPFSYHHNSVQHLSFEKVEFINQELPDGEFVIRPIPSGTNVVDTRPKSGAAVGPNGQRTVDLGRYPFRQFTTGAEYSDGFPAALLKELDRDVVTPVNTPAAKAGEPITADGAREWHPPKEQLLYGGKRFADWEQQLLNDLEPKRQIEAIAALEAFGTKGYAHEASAAIGQALKTAPVDVKYAALDALARIGEVSVPFLIEALQSKHLEVRKTAAFSIGRIGPAAKPASDALIKANEDENIQVRAAAAWALACVGAGDIKLRPVLQRLVRDDDVAVRRSAVAGLSEAFANVRDLLPILVEALADDDSGVRLPAGKALLRNAEPLPEVVDGLKRLARDDVDHLRLSNCFLSALTSENQNLDTRAPVLIDAASLVLRNSFYAMQSTPEEVLAALRRLGPKASSAVPSLIGFIDIDHPPARDQLILAAMDTLGAIGPAARDAVPALKAWTDRLKKPDRDCERIEKHALKAIEKITPGDEN